MAQYVEKRRCRRFEIPGGEVKYKKIGLLILNKDFSKAYSLLNVSKGGLAFVCEKKFRRGKKLMLQLLAPNEIPLNLRSRVRWQGQWAGSTFRVTGAEFMPFGTRRSWNSLEALDVLGRLDAQYGKEGEED
jgi:hypothetical protein